MRQPFYNIYAFCRTADDIADESPSVTDAIQGLETLQSDLDRLYSGNPPESRFFPALATTVEQFRLSKSHFDDLIAAFRQDQRKNRYSTEEELIDYCDHSANPVGRLVLELAGSLDPETRRLSDKICTGLQLANFWQDVARDYQIGRVYLPLNRCEQFGIAAEQLSDRSTPPALKQLLKELCEDAERLFRDGLPLAEMVPGWLSADIKLFAHGGLETLNAIRKIDFDVLRIRPKVSKTTQLLLVAKAAMGWLR